VDIGVEWKFQMWMICEPCWRGRVYAYMEQRKARQSAADGLPDHAVVRTQNTILLSERASGQTQNTKYQEDQTDLLPDRR
jgi:hypothetical protein